MSRTILGLDIGGSASRARLCIGGDAMDSSGPGANIATLEPREVDDRLSALVGRLRDARPEACCAGAAGAEMPAARAHLEALLESLLPGCRVAVVHDTRLVLAAAGLDAGIALVAGTGAVAYGRRDDGRELQRGGWGWLVGDDGGGAWIARESARAVMGRADAGLPIGPLGDALLKASFAADPRAMLVALHAMREPAGWAALAGVVFETAEVDDASASILDRAAESLSTLVRDVAGSLGMAGPVILAGGLLLHQPRLESAVRERVAMACRRLDEPPVAGAVRLAEALVPA